MDEDPVKAKERCLSFKELYGQWNYQHYVGDLWSHEVGEQSYFGIQKGSNVFGAQALLEVSLSELFEAQSVDKI